MAQLACSNLNNEYRKPPCKYGLSTSFFFLEKRHDCFLTRICAVNCLRILRNFLYRAWKYNNVEMKVCFRINDGDRTEVTSMLKCHYLKLLFSSYCVSECACGSQSLSCLLANIGARRWQEMCSSGGWLWGRSELLTLSLRKKEMERSFCLRI